MANDTKNNELKEALDQVDRRLLDMLNQRGQLALKWSRLKEQNEKPEFSAERQMERLRAQEQYHRGPLPPQAVNRIFAEIVSACRAVHKPLQVTFLGPDGSYSHQAALRYFGGSCSFVSLSSMIDVFEEVERGHSPVGVAPAENSCEGGTTITLDLFLDSDLQICGEIYDEITLNLLSSATSLEKINRVYAHSHVFSQCRNWLSRNLPHASLQLATNIAEAAQKVKKGSKIATIGSELAADIYDLPVRSRGIQDALHNYTRYFVLGRQEPPQTGNDKTTILFHAAHHPGALYRALGIFAEKGLNMTRIESRLISGKAWDYAFFLDFLGHRTDPLVKDALLELTEGVDFCKILGSYPTEA